jgi:hypothetical protein
MVAHGPGGVPSRTGVRLGDEVEWSKRSQIATHNAKAFQRRVAAKGACGGAQAVMRPRGPLVIGGTPAGVSRRAIRGLVMSPCSW